MAGTWLEPLPDFLERRGTPRWPVDFLLTYGVGTESYQGRAQDMSETGLRFEGEHGYPEGTVIRLVLLSRSLEGQEQPIHLEARVCHREGASLGVEFFDLTPEQEAAILETLYQMIALSRR